MTTPLAYTLTSMTWSEVQLALNTARLAIIPTGSCEQHGPNMTLETDAAICYSLAERLAQRLYPRALLAPLLPLGVSPHHMSFPGTITLRPETYEAVLWDVVASLKQHGLSHFLLVNGHGGNVAPLKVIGMKLRRELGVQVAIMFYMQLAADVIKAGAKTKLYGHACEVEASVGLYLAPHIVKAERVAGEIRPYAHAHTDIKSGAQLDYPFMFEEFTANGALGDARLATIEFGQVIVETALERTLEFLQSFLEAE
ncbi:MAG TPA: creatininase family protein [Anaerolineae bacterium]|nr:creatininase family protein [Anaerolineae bacterium]